MILPKDCHFLGLEKVATFMWYPTIVAEKLEYFKQVKTFWRPLIWLPPPNRLVWIRHWDVFSRCRPVLVRTFTISTSTADATNFIIYALCLWRKNAIVAIKWVVDKPEHCSSQKPSTKRYLFFIWFRLVVSVVYHGKWFSLMASIRIRNLDSPSSVALNDIGKCQAHCKVRLFDLARVTLMRLR